MKPEGRKMINFPAKRDCHPRKGYVNWWENIGDYISRKTRKQKTAADIASEVIKEVCSSCCWSCCDPLDENCKYHPIDKDRWCHKYNKSVFNLEDASNCKE